MVGTPNTLARSKIAGPQWCLCVGLGGDSARETHASVHHVLLNLATSLEVVRPPRAPSEKEHRDGPMRSLLSVQQRVEASSASSACSVPGTGL